MDSLATVPLSTVEQVDAVIAARAVSYGHHGGWGTLVREAMDAAGGLYGRMATDELPPPTEVLGADWGRTAFLPLAVGTVAAHERAQSLVDNTLQWAEAQSPPLCSLVERVLASIGLGAYVASRPPRPSLR